MWDVATGKVVRKFYGHEQRVNTVSFNFESTVLVTGSYDKTVRCWDCRTHTRAAIQIMDHFSDSVTSLVVPSSQTGRHEIWAGSVDGCVRCFDLRAGRVRTDVLVDPVTSIAVSGDGECLLAMCLGGKLRLVEKGGGTLLNTYEGHTHESFPLECTFSHTDEHVLGASEDGAVVCWDLVEGKVVHRIEAHSRPVSSLAYHPSETMRLTASYDGLVKVWTGVPG